ncbi:hypothetical protein BD410DRAFT_846596 [Rickenella mellea]|uniref:Uncharacterized protein n=1 Tax=Rickenella mellea TaxID=50990 RepID=A0A4Y7PGR3_9AGAM|nr:hypothetical protein BD410DRAFT_846836 [Rickenella mellea]TDL13819.1 hypothetical protein BD410DRAFT_846596 [Rickenella mellea]
MSKRTLSLSSSRTTARKRQEFASPDSEETNLCTEEAEAAVESMLAVLPQKLLYVPDRWGASKRVDAVDRHTSFRRAKLTVKEWKALDPVKNSLHNPDPDEWGHVFQVTDEAEEENRVNVVIHEWLLVAIYLSRASFDVEYMDWHDFMEEIEQTESSDVFSKYVCILGGVDFSTDYLDPQYGGMTEQGADNYYIGKMRKISRKVRIFPDPEQLLRIGNKWDLIRSLDEIARKFTRSGRPITTRLEHGGHLPTDQVIKRTHSGTSNSVIMPGDLHNRPHSWEELETPSSSMIWFSQTLVDTLWNQGEWRVVVVGGSVKYVVHTLKTDTNDYNRWEWYPTFVTDFYTLQELSYMAETGSLASATLSEPPGDRPADVRSQGVEEFRSFVSKTLDELAKDEERHIGRKSSLRLFCRLDIGIIVSPGTNNAVTYFVNEVGASMNASLWNGLEAVDPVGPSFAEAFSKWI